MVNDLGREIHPNVLWRNDGPGGDGWKFEDVSIAMDASVRMDGMGLAIGDYDLDGRFDIFLTNINDNVLLRNPGGGKPFVDVAPEAGAEIGLLGRRPRIAWGAMFIDYDNDADEDLYVVSGYLDAPQPRNSKEQPNALLRNNGDGTFAEVSGSSGADDDGIGRGGAYIDFDQDGCLDMIVVNYGQPARLFRNECDTGNSWLVVRTQGTTGNRDAIGALITAEAGILPNQAHLRWFELDGPEHDGGPLRPRRSGPGGLADHQVARRQGPDHYRRAGQPGPAGDGA